MQQKRKILFDNYDTAVDGLWTLAACALSDATPLTNFIDVPGRLDGPLDASTALTGDVQYGPRTLEITLESSEGTRQEREERINQMVNRLHGQRVPIRLPDDDGHYLVGRISVKKNYNDLVHASVTVSAVCEPWKYENDETVHEITVEGNTIEAMLENERRRVIPLLTVQGAVVLEYAGNRYELQGGLHKLPDLLLTTQGVKVKVSGSGSVSFAYRKAVL